MTCTVCGSAFEARAGAQTCSARCRKRRQRGTYVVTAEDRAAMRRVEELVPIPVPALTPEQVRAHVLAHARMG